MSDLFEKYGERSLPDTVQGADWRANMENFRQKANQQGKENLAQREADVNKYKINLSDDQFEFLRRAAESGTVDEDEMYKQAASIFIADRHGLPAPMVRKNLDEFSLALNINREQYPPAAFWDVVKSRYRMADNNTKANELKWELRNASDPQFREALIKEIRRLEEENSSLYDTGEIDTKTAKGKALWALATITDSIPYMRNMMIRQAAGNVIGSILGIPKLGKLDVGRLAGWNYGKNVEGGALYWDLLEAGVAHDVAEKWSMVGGSLSSGVEQLLMGSIEAMAGGIGGLATGKPAIGSTSNWIVSHVFTKLEPGGAGHRVMNLLTDYLLNIPKEGIEEGTQGITTGAAARQAVGEHNRKVQEAVDSLPEEQREALMAVLETIPEGEDRAVHAFTGMLTAMAIDTIREADLRGDISELPEDLQEAVYALREIQKKPWKEIFKEARDEAAAGAVAAIGTGVPGVAFNSMASVREARRLKRNAASGVNFEAFAQEARKSNNFEGTAPEKVEESVKKIWEAGQQQREREEAKRAEELRNKRLYGAADKSGDPAFRDEGGDLYMEVERHTESGGLSTFEFTVGDPYKGDQNTYAIGKVEIRGDTPVITQFNIFEAYEGLQDEILQNLANEFGKEFTYREQRYASNGEGRSLRYGDWGAEKAARAGRGFDFNKPYYSEPDTQADTAAKQNFAAQLKKLDTRLEGDAAVKTVVDFYDTAGRKWFGMGFDAFINRLTGGKPDSLLTQELSDEEIARWVANNEGVITDEAAVQRIRENLTDAQREDARQNMYGFATPGADGVTKAIYAARDADVSTFIHEGVHAFTLLAKALDPSLYRQMMEAAGFSQEEYNRADAAGKERITRQAMERLAYGTEVYLKEGVKSVKDPVLKNLYEKIKEFLKDLKFAAEKAEYLTPEVRALFDNLFGERGQEGAETAQTGKDTATGAESQQEAAKTQQKANEETAAKTPDAEEPEIYSDSFDRIIKDDSLPIEERAEAVMRKAGRYYSDALLDKRDQGHRPTMELIKRAKRITDEAEKARVIAEIRELRKRYAGTEAEFKAPNGKDSLLLSSLGAERGKEAWYAVRLENFKKWFGDWEQAARIEAIEKLDAEKVNINNPINQKEAEKIARSFKPIKNSNDGRIAEIPVNTIGKIIKHKGFDISRIIENIPALYKKSKLGWSEPEIQREGHKTHTNIKEYHHYINKFTDGTNEYFIRIIVNEERTNSGKTGKNNIHSTAVSNVNTNKSKTAAGSIVSVIIGTGEANSAPPFIDLRLAEFFNSVKGNISKIVDENGEPLPVFRGDQAGKDRFTNRQGVYFSADKTVAEDYASGGLYDLFLNIKNPLILDKITFNETRERINDMLEDIYEQDWSELEHNEQFQKLKENYLTFRNEEGSYVREFYDFLPAVSEDTDLDELKEILMKSVHDANTFEWRQIEYKDIDILNPFIKTLGYDGIVRPYDPLGQARGNEYVTFEPNQIKSAADNAGTFDPNNPSILFSDAFQASIYQFDKHNNSYVGSSVGKLRHGWGHYFYSKKEAAEWFRQSVSKYYGSDVVGQLYGVDIPDDHELLHWEKTISEQPEAVQQTADKLIAWNKDGKSNFNKAYNVRKFKDGSYGFFRSINGKAKWSTIAEAQNAAREEIKKTLTGKEFYNTLAESVGAKETSLLLDHLGIRGTKYLDKSIEKAGIPKSYNYVIYGDSEINITQTFYSEAFRDAEFSEFMSNYPEVVKEAARFSSGAEMAEYYADWLQMPDEVYRKARALGYFDALARAAKEGNAEDATNVITGVSAKKAAEALAAYGADAKYAHEAASLTKRDNWQGAVELLEKHGVPRIDAETYADTANAFSRTEMLWLKKQAETAAVPNADDNAKPKKLGAENQAVRKFFDTLVDGAKEIYPDEDIEAQRAELAGEPRTAKAFIDMIYTDKGFDDLMEAAYATQREGSIRGETDEETQRNEALFDRVRRTFNPEGNGNWKVAFADMGARRKVNSHTKKILQGMIRNRPLQYMEAWAMLTGDDTWLPGENDVQRIRRLDTEGLVDEEYLEKQSPEELERIGRRLSSERVKKKIEDKTLLLDDPDLNEHERQLKEDMARARELIAKREEGFEEYRYWIDLAELNARREQMLLEQGAADTSNEGLKKSREQIKKTAEAHKQVRDAIERMERFMQEKLLPTQRAAFVELRRQFKEKERINAELKAIAEIREIKKRNLKQILRKPDLKTVSVNEAKLIEWIQAHFDSYETVARFIGRGAKDIRKLYNEFATSPEYRDKLKKKLPPMAFHQIERIVFKDLAGREVRAYGEIDARQRRALYKHLIDHQGIFEELGIDILAEPRKFSEAEWEAIREEMKDRIPADVLSKLEGLIYENGVRRFEVENLKDSDLQTLAGVVNKLRKEGREREAARKDARTQLWQEGQEKILETLRSHLPKNAIGVRMAGIAATKLEEQRRSGKLSVWHALHNARRFFRMLEGHKDGFLHDYITQREYDAFDEENRHVFERREKVEKELKDAGIDIKDLGRIRFTLLWNGQEVTLDEMLTFYYAMKNERALHAVVFGNFATQEERNALKAMAEARDIEGGLGLESEIGLRYGKDMKQLDDFLAKGENWKFQQVMNIIGRDYDDNYGRLKEFAAREFNEELGSEPYYMPLSRLSVAAEENNDFEQAMADAGHSPYIARGFMKGRVDIPSFGQTAIQAGFYAAWDRMVTKQEHLMAYGSLHREMKQIFQGQGSETLREILRRGHSESAVNYVEKFISELAAPPVQEDLAAMNTINRIIRGHFPAAVLGWRAASIVKQAIESPPPFFQYVSPAQYATAGAACLRQETRDMIYEKSVYMKSRYFDPAMAVVREMERMFLTGKLGKAEAALAKIESIVMKPQTWIDSVCVMPGWLAAYNKKLAELNKSDTGMTVEEAEAAAVRYADGVVRDCQPSSVLMDQAPMLKGDKHPFVRMFQQFQTPIASIFQQLFMDAPDQFRQGRILQGLWTWGIYALLAIVIGAMHEDDDDDTLDPKKRMIDALVMPFSMVPVFGGDLSYAMETLFRDGKIRMPRRVYFPVLDQAMKTGNAITDEKWGKAAWEAVKGFGYYSGLPVGAAQDIEKAVETGKPQRAFGIR